MKGTNERFLLASAPDSWGVVRVSRTSWEQSYEKGLDEMAAAGCAGPELGPYGYCPTDPDILERID